jgi:predicted neutral ceramidase superfamily lipid hydrolase
MDCVALHNESLPIANALSILFAHVLYSKVYTVARPIIEAFAVHVIHILPNFIKSSETFQDQLFTTMPPFISSSEINGGSYIR